MQLSKSRLALVLATGLAAAAPLSTSAGHNDGHKKDGGVQSGLLTCQVASGWGFVIGSSRDLRCVWEPTKGVSYNYEGTIGQFGVDIGYHRSSVMLWTVVAATSDKGAKTLEGTFGGVTAQVSAGVGVLRRARACCRD